jgi:hypothetical protein
MARRPRHFTPESFMGAIEPDPFADAVFTDTLGVAGELGDFLDQLKAFDVSSIKAMLYRKPASGVGGYAYLGVVPAPIHMDAVMEYLKEEFGGGDYRVSVFAGGKTRKQIEFPIYGLAKPLKSINGTSTASSGDMKPTDMLGLFMQMQESARREAAERRSEMMEQLRADRERDRDRTSAMVALAGSIAPALIPVLFNREKLSELLAIMKAGEGEKSSLKDTVELVVLLKKAFGEDRGGDFDPENVMGSIARLAGPVVGGLGRAFSANRAPPQEEASPAELGELHLPPPEPPQIAPAAAPGAPANPVLHLIRPHLLYLYSAQLPPDLAADALVDIMERSGVTDENLNELVAAFTLSPDWKADLAAQGIDLRGNPGWADELLSELVAAWTSRDDDGDSGPGRTGGVADPEDHAEAGPPGLEIDDRKEASA